MNVSELLKAIHRLIEEHPEVLEYDVTDCEYGSIIHKTLINDEYKEITFSTEETRI